MTSLFCTFRAGSSMLRQHDRQHVERVFFNGSLQCLHSVDSGARRELPCFDPSFGRGDLVVRGAGNASAVAEFDRDDFAFPVVRLVLDTSPSLSGEHGVASPNLCDRNVTVSGGYHSTTHHAPLVDGPAFFLSTLQDGGHRSVRVLVGRGHDRVRFQSDAVLILLTHRLTLRRLQDVHVHLIDLVQTHPLRVGATD